MSETQLYTDILKTHAHGGTRLFRFNSGMAYQGKVIERSANRLILAPWYPVRLAPEGFSDLAGWTREGIDCGPAIFLAIEGKIGRKQSTAEQTAFLETVRLMGGRAGIARSVEDAGLIIHGL